MALLSKSKRKEYFTYLGLGKYSKKNIKKFQKIAFPDKPEEWDGSFGPKTDKALRHWRNVRKYAPNFRPEEFKCGCGGRFCTGYPTQMRVRELVILQTIRNHYRKPMTVTSGLRCDRFNATLRGSSPNSRHKLGKATDFYMSGVTDSVEHRKKAIRYAKTLTGFRYGYGNGINSYGEKVTAPNMGNALHIDCE